MCLTLAAELVGPAGVTECDVTSACCWRGFRTCAVVPPPPAADGGGHVGFPGLLDSISLIGELSGDDFSSGMFSSMLPVLLFKHDKNLKNLDLFLVLPIMHFCVTDSTKMF